MKYLVDSREMQKYDANTISHFKVPGLLLMERAAIAFVEELHRQNVDLTEVLIVCGSGNNGGDGLAIARLLFLEGHAVTVVYAGNKEHCSESNRVQQDILNAYGISIYMDIPEKIRPALVIDAIFGVGLSRDVTGEYADMLCRMNELSGEKAAVDIASGISADTGAILGTAFRADLTITFQYPKLAFMFAENEQFTGEWKIVDIGIHPDIIEQTETKYYYIELDEAARMIMKRSRFVSKHNVGHTLLIAGSKGMMGAAVLAAKAALHTGAGLVSVLSAACGEKILQTSVPEALFIADEQDSHISDIVLNRSYSAIAVGPGLGRHEETARAFYKLLGQIKRPIVLDADALNLLAGHTELIENLPKNTILTPHHLEFDRLFGKNDTSYERLNKAREMAIRYHIIIVLKGANTAIITPKGDVLFNSSGNAGMATAGSGDTLTGMITGLLAQGYHPIPAAILGVFLHGMAGDLAAEKDSQEYITARDIISQIGQAYKKLHNYRV